MVDSGIMETEELYIKLGKFFFIYNTEKNKLGYHAVEFNNNEVGEFIGYSVPLISKTEEGKYVPSNGFLDTVNNNPEIRDHVILGVISGNEILNKVVQKQIESKTNKMKRTAGYFKNVSLKYKKELESRDKIVEKLTKNYQDSQKIIDELEIGDLTIDEIIKLKEQNKFLTDRLIKYSNNYSEIDRKITELESGNSKLREKLKNQKEKPDLTDNITTGATEYFDIGFVENDEESPDLLQKPKQDSKIKTINENSNNPYTSRYKFKKSYMCLQVKNRDDDLDNFIIVKGGELMKVPEILYKLYKKVKVPMNINTRVSGKLYSAGLVTNQDPSSMELTDLGRAIIKDIVKNKPEFFKNLELDVDEGLSYAFENDYQKLKVNLDNEDGLVSRGFNLFNKKGEMAATPKVLYWLYQNKKVQSYHSSYLTILRRLDLVEGWKKNGGEPKLTEKGKEIMNKWVEKMGSVFSTQASY